MSENITYYGKIYNITQPDPPLGLPAPAYCQLVHTRTAILPPPLADTPEALFARNQAAIDKVAALLPVGANEADLAAQCVASRAQAEEVMRLLRGAHATMSATRLAPRHADEGRHP